MLLPLALHTIHVHKQTEVSTGEGWVCFVCICVLQVIVQATYVLTDLLGANHTFSLLSQHIQIYHSLLFAENYIVFVCPLEYHQV